MSLWIIRRLIQALGIVMIMTVIVFVAVNVIGDPIELLISPEADQTERTRLAAEFGFDQPLWRQYLRFLGGLLQGDFGNSFVYGESALKVIFLRMPATLELAFCTMVVSTLIGVPLGLYAGLRPKAVSSRVLMGGSILGFSLPSFWSGLLLIMIFSVNLQWLPTTGRGDTVEVFGLHFSFLTLDGLSHLVLPVTTLSLFMTALIMRLTRAGVREILPQEFIKFARAKGLSETRVITVHILKNILVTLVTILGLEFASLIAFSVVTETIFSWPGMGKLIIDSINKLDRPVIVAYLVLIVLLFVVINLLVDFLYTLLDPRVRIDGQS